MAKKCQGFEDEILALGPSKSDFRPRFGTVLVALVNDCHQLDEGKSALLILLDVSAVFDTVEHLILDHGTTLAWFLSCHWRVAVGNECTAEHFLKCGLPQGMVLFPLLFSISIYISIRAR